MSAPTVADVVAILRRELLVDLRPIEFDLTIDDETGDLQLATDSWTLAIEHPESAPSAWVAIDAEPDTDHEYEHALKDAFRPMEIAALRRANAALDGLLAAALIASTDSFSAFFARALQ